MPSFATIDSLSWRLWRNGGWVCSEFQMAEDLANDLTLRDDGDESQHPVLTQWTHGHLQGKHALQEPGPGPIRAAPLRLLPVHPLLAWSGTDGLAQCAMGCQTAGIADEVHTRQGHERGQLLQEFQRREANPRGAIGPRMSEGVDELTVGVLLEALQRHGPAGRIANELFQLIPPMRRNRCVGMQRKPVDTGTPRPSEPWRLALRAKTRADTAYVLPGPVPEGDALLHRSRHGAGELRGGIAQGVIPGGHGGLHARLQVAQPTQRTDDPVTDLLEDRGDVDIARWLAREKAGFAPFVGAIEVDPLHKDAMDMEVELERTPKALDKRDRSRVDLLPLYATLDRLVDIILPDGGTNDRMDLGREVLGRRHPVAQRDRHRDDPLASRHPGHDARDEVGRRLGHAPGCTRGTKPAPLATEGQQQLFRARVTAV